MQAMASTLKSLEASVGAISIVDTPAAPEDDTAKLITQARRES